MAWDDVKNIALNPKEVAKARGMEMQYVAKHKVYTYAPISECRAKTGAEPIGTKWIDTNKGDSTNPCYRSRWVAQQFRRAYIETMFAATPNIEAARLLLADAASRSRPNDKEGSQIRTMIIDIKRAYFYAPSQRDVYVKLPPEDPKSKDPSLCAKLMKSLYGTRDAGANWHEEYSAFLKSIDLLQGAVSYTHLTLPTNREV